MKTITPSPRPPSQCALNRRVLFVYVIGTLFLLMTISNGLAQATMRFGFEEFPLNSRPPFVTGFGGIAVSDGTSQYAVKCPPYEGQKYVGASALTFIASPDGQFIESFTIHLWVAPPQSGSAYTLRIGGQPEVIQQFGAWQTFQGSFSSPVEKLEIYGYSSFEGAPVLFYAVDGVEFTTIPETKTFWLLTIGLAAIAFRRRKTHPQTNRG